MHRNFCLMFEVVSKQIFIFIVRRVFNNLRIFDMNVYYAWVLSGFNTNALTPIVGVNWTKLLNWNDAYFLLLFFCTSWKFFIRHHRSELYCFDTFHDIILGIVIKLRHLYCSPLRTNFKTFSFCDNRGFTLESIFIAVGLL